MAQSILIVKLSSLGDVIHTLPAAQALRRQFPDAHLAWAVERAHAGVLRGLPVVDELIEWDRGTLRGLFDFVRRLRARRWDIAIDFQGLFRSALVTRLSGAPRRIGYAPSRELAHLACNERVPAPTKTLHAVEKSLRLAEATGASIAGFTRATPSLFPLPITLRERLAVDGWLNAHHFDPRHERLVVLNPHCRKEANIWPVERFAALAGRLLDESPNVRIALCGGQASKSLCDTIAAAAPERILRADGMFSLLGSAELIRRAAVFVTGDTGPMHIAAAVGTPIVALFGPADPVKTGPYTDRAVVLNKKLPCGPCFARKCPLGHDPPKCMTDIEVDEVLAAVRAELAAAPVPNEAPGRPLRRTA